jgi:zinc transport system permease protein
MRHALIAVLLLAPAAAALGVCVINLRQSFFSDAVGHAAIAGVAAALLLGVDPRLGTVAVALALSALLLLVLHRTRLSPETATVIIGGSVIALGAALLSGAPALRRQAQGVLFGDLLAVTTTDLWLLAGLATLVWAFVLVGYNRLLAIAFDAELARAHGVRVAAWRWGLAIVLALTAASAARCVGILLVTPLLLIPAATARGVSRRAGAQPWLAAGCGLIAGVAGLAASAQWNVAPGALIVLAAAALFALSCLLPRASR